MSTDICHIYQQLCLKNNVMPDECILSCLNNARYLEIKYNLIITYDSFNLKNFFLARMEN